LIEFIEKGKVSYIEYLKMEVKSSKNENHSNENGSRNKLQDDTHPNPLMSNTTYV
ncbi:14210_t:CDS:1, partial [Rhizophagus irregularis]